MSMSSPFLNDLTVENLTAHVLKTNSYGDDERATYVLSCLVQHLHDFVRETKLTTEEWEMAWQYLTKVGKYCTPDRQEMILLSDVLGVSALVDAVNNPISKSATESSVLGPFHNDAHELSNGDSITSSNAVGEPMLISGTVKDVNGMPIRGAAVDLWETNGNGFYDMQDPEKDGPDCRGIFYTDSEGAFYCVGVRSVDYPIPDDGPVGDLLRLLGRSNMRPAHVHFAINHHDYRTLTTALYAKGSRCIATDPVFGVKKSLIKPFAWSEDLNLAQSFGIRTFQRQDKKAPGFWSLEHDFVMVQAS